MTDAADGRNLRRTRNTDVVVGAMLDLLADGNLWPSAADIAARAGLSERSVYRYFDDLDTLAQAAVELQIERADHLFQPLAADGTLDVRLDRLVRHRVRMFDQIGGIVHAARLRASLRETIAAALALRQQQLRVQLQELFLEELDGQEDDLLTALEVVTGLDSLHALRIDRKCSAPRTRRIMRRTAEALLTFRP
jgi:AcrR family transcriptional regulator